MRRAGNSDRMVRNKRWFFGVLMVAGLLLVFALAACGEEETTTTTAAPSTTVAPTSTSAPPQTTASTETTTTQAQPVVGGKIRWIPPSLPQTFYYPETGPGDQLGLTPGMERLLNLNSNRELVPELAESIEEDPDGLTFTIHVRKGVKLHDGTELNADLVKWLLEEEKKSGKLTWGQYYQSFEIKDPYTVVAKVTQWNNIMLSGLGEVPVYSRQALEKNGVEWCRTNFVGTGPYIMKQFNRDQNLIWVKNPDYWQKDQGKPYLDEIEFVFIPDMNTSKAAMESKEMDVWTGANAQMLSEMKAKGLTLQSAWPGSYGTLVPNIVDENSPFRDQRVREALEYALDKEALAQALGYGLSMPVWELSSPNHWGYGAGAQYKREYNPEKAKQLLAEAGYPNGLPVNLLAMVQAGGTNTDAEAIRGYLEAAGFKVTLDIADVGRYFGSIFGTGWKDLALVAIFGYTQANDLIDFTYWWSGLAAKVNWGSWKASPELVNLFNEALVLRDMKAVEAKVGEIVALMAKEAQVIPLFYMPSYAIVQPYVHVDFPASGLIHVDWPNAWTEKK
ncbi:MAG: ABC transporter substrate-binding protein [Thermoleophilia bacterium]|nr:ABC transporter substrate-binding protein [Thermoleophilia bacterium]